MRRNRFIALLLLMLMLVIIPVQANTQEVHSSIESAAAELRQAMAARKDSVTIYYQTDAETDLNRPLRIF